MNILTIDIETSPNDAWTWGLWQQNVSLKQLKTPTRMLSWAAKVYGKRGVIYRSWTDPDFLDKLRELLLDADAVITYNGDSFDLKHIRREFAEADLPPLRPIASIDLFKTVKANFKFPSNKLDYVAGQLIGEHKLDTGGFDLWPLFMEGDPKALRLMKRYNVRDTVVTEKLYTFLRPWIRNHPYLADVGNILNDNETDYRCPVCDSDKCVITRPRRTRCFAIRQVLCTTCGHWFDGMRKKIK